MPRSLLRLPAISLSALLPFQNRFPTIPCRSSRQLVARLLDGEANRICIESGRFSDSHAAESPNCCGDAAKATKCRLRAVATFVGGFWALAARREAVSL